MKVKLSCRHNVIKINSLVMTTSLYILLLWQHVCFVDINECDEMDTLCCHDNQACKNTDGGYECGCQIGYAPDESSSALLKCIGRHLSLSNVPFLNS